VWKGGRVRVFISYSRDDLAVVGELEGDLEAAGHMVFRDEEMSGGQHWWERLLREIRESDVFVFALSRTSLTSRPCQLEYRYAHALRRTILPVRIDRAVSVQELPPELSTLQLVEYQRDDKAASLALVRAVSDLPAPPPLPDPLPGEPEVPISYVTELRDQLTDPRPLPAETQAGILAELDRRLRADDDPVAIENLLRRLLRRSDATAGTKRRSKRMLASIEASKPKPDRAPSRMGLYLGGGVALAAVIVTSAVLIMQPDRNQPPPDDGASPGTVAGLLDPVDTAPAAETTTTVPGSSGLTTAQSAATAPAAGAEQDIEMALLDEFAGQAAFDADLGCYDGVVERAIYLGSTWDPAYLGSWSDGVAEWLWDPEFLTWIRDDGLTYHPNTDQYWSYCTGRWWDPVAAAWVG
jgi:hypothetical protein